MSCKTCNRPADAPYVNIVAGEQCADPCHVIGSIVSSEGRGEYQVAGHWRGYVTLLCLSTGTSFKAHPAGIDW